MNKRRSVLLGVPKHVQKSFGLADHMRQRPPGTPRHLWTLKWIQALPQSVRVVDPIAHLASKRSARPRPAIASGFLQSYAWRELRMRVIVKRGNRCECCGASPTDGHTVINVDHIKPRRDYPALALVESNLQILCGACNHGKGNWDETDWRQEDTFDVDITLEDAARLAEKYKM